MKRSLAAIAFLIPACIRPDESLIRILCGNGQPACPDGQTCVDGFCATGSGAADLAMSSSDLAAVPDLTEVQGCKAGGGMSAGPSATACPGTFNVGEARGRCASGWQVCVTAANVDQTAANKLPGFFVADQPAFWAGIRTAETCLTSITQQIFYGVGQGGMPGPKMCGGFLRELEVGSGWTTSNGTLDQARNTVATDGVLCCR